MRVLNIFLFLFLLSACDGRKSTTDEVSKSEGDSKTEHYSLEFKPGTLKKGEPGNALLKVTPGAGFKMNKEFPVKLKLKPGTDWKVAKEELKVADVKLNESALEFPLSLTPNVSGRVKLEALADFSVCNDQSCKLIRGLELSWGLQVQ